MKNLNTLNELESESFLNSIFKNEITVFEDIQGSKIWLNWNGSQFILKSKSINSEPINLVDLAMQNYYNPAINYFNSLDLRVKSLLNKKWWFCFEYFPDNQPANIEYDRVPKNNLILTTIFKNGKYEMNIDEIDEYSRLMNVDMIPVIFKGTLNEKMKEAIKYFLNTSEDDLEYVFGDKSFSFFFYKILNPFLENSFLMEEGEFQKNIEKLIIRSEENNISFSLLNPLYKKINDSNKTDYVEIYSLLIINFLNFCQSINLEDLKLSGHKREEAYISLISKLYNFYLNDVKEDLINFDFTIPQFFDKEKFKINRELIKNKMTKSYINENSKLEYIFKIILSSFNKKRKKSIGLFSDNTVKLFNLFVDKINDTIDVYLNKTKEVELTRAGLLDFDEYIDFKVDTDSSGQIYPDIFDEIQKGEEEEKKKKGKGGKMPMPGDESKMSLK
jgi:hypothetical protein